MLIESDKIKGSKLRPDVPAFVPRSSESETGYLSKGNFKDHYKKDKESKKSRNSLKNSSLGTDGMLTFYQYFMTELMNFTDALPSTAEESTSARLSNETTTEVDVSGSEKPKAKRSRYGRRNQTKSEPASRVQDSTDGAQDEEMIAGSSGEGLPMTESSSMVCHHLLMMIIC